jgi:hypothetical protein
MLSIIWGDSADDVDPGNNTATIFRMNLGRNESIKSVNLSSISFIATENVKQTQLNEWWRPLMGVCQNKRFHTWHMDLLDANLTRQQV